MKLPSETVRVQSRKIFRLEEEIRQLRMQHAAATKIWPIDTAPSGVWLQLVFRPPRTNTPPAAVIAHYDDTADEWKDGFGEKAKVGENSEPVGWLPIHFWRDPSGLLTDPTDTVNGFHS